MRIAVLSDIHANLPALEAVLAALGPVDAVWHLGDVVGYGPHPDEVVARLRELGAVGVRGNHDAATQDLGMAEWFNADARRAIEWTAGRISPETRAWLAGLPERAELGEMTLVHGAWTTGAWSRWAPPMAPSCRSTGDASSSIRAASANLATATRAPARRSWTWLLRR